MSRKHFESRAKKNYENARKRTSAIVCCAAVVHPYCRSEQKHDFALEISDKRFLRNCSRQQPTLRVARGFCDCTLVCNLLVQIRGGQPWHNAPLNYSTTSGGALLLLLFIRVSYFVFFECPYIYFLLKIIQLKLIKAHLRKNWPLLIQIVMNISRIQKPIMLHNFEKIIKVIKRD